MANPTAAFVVIGDEILSGKTRDANINVLARALTRVGVDLVEVRVVPDVEAAIVTTVNELRGRVDVLFTSGGIGPTHDDITADSIAAAFGVGIGVREDARDLLAAAMAARGRPVTDGLLRMARIPDGATLIPNPVSAAPGFRMGNVHVLAGVPDIFEAMVAECLPLLPTGVPVRSRSLTTGLGESVFAAGLSAVAADFPDLTIGSYPYSDDGGFAVEIVVRGTDPARIDAAAARVADLLGTPDHP